MYVQAARLQKDRQAAAANWRANLSSGGIQLKNNVNKPRDDQEQLENKKNQVKAEEREAVRRDEPELDVQGRAQWDRYVSA